MIEKCDSPLQVPTRAEGILDVCSGKVIGGWKPPTPVLCTQRPKPASGPPPALGPSRLLANPSALRPGRHLFPTLSASPGSNRNPLCCRWNLSLSGSWGLLSRGPTQLQRLEVGALEASKCPSMAPPARLLGLSRTGMEGATSLVGCLGVSLRMTSVLRHHEEVLTGIESSLWVQPGHSHSGWSADA